MLKLKCVGSGSGEAGEPAATLPDEHDNAVAAAALLSETCRQR